MTRREAFGIRPVVCPSCPFHRVKLGRQLRDSLSPERRREIVDSMLVEGRSFLCHSEAHGLEPAGPAGPRQCTGAAVVLAREGHPNQVMQIAARLGEPPFVDPGERVIPWTSLEDWARPEDP